MKIAENMSGYDNINEIFLDTVKADAANNVYYQIGTGGHEFAMEAGDTFSINLFF